MTTNACAKRGFYSENPSARLWKAIAFAGGLVLGLYSDPLPAALSSDGTIGEMATRRSEFAAIPKLEAIGGLISALDRKTESCAMSAARTFWELPFEFPAAIQPYGQSSRGFAFTPETLEAETSDE